MDTEAPPVYQIIALEARQLHDLGMNYSRIAECLGMAHKTVAKSLRWFSSHNNDSCYRSCGM
jgi:hypothetical protein